jgi:hypothetical protein
MNVNLVWVVNGTGPIDARHAQWHAALAEYRATDMPSLIRWLLELLYGPPEGATVFGATEMNVPPLMGMGEDSMEPTILEGNLLLIDRSFGLSSMECRRAQRGDRLTMEFMPSSLAHCLKVRTIRPVT